MFPPSTRASPATDGGAVSHRIMVAIMGEDAGDVHGQGENTGDVHGQDGNAGEGNERAGGDPAVGGDPSDGNEPGVGGDPKH